MNSIRAWLRHFDPGYGCNVCGMLMLDLQNSFNLALFSPSVNFFFFFEVLSLKYSNYSLVAWLEKFYKPIVLALEYVFSSQCSLSLNRLVTLGPDIGPFL